MITMNYDDLKKQLPTSVLNTPGILQVPVGSWNTAFPEGDLIDKGEQVILTPVSKVLQILEESNE